MKKHRIKRLFAVEKARNLKGVVMFFKKKNKSNEKYRFNFEKYPELLEKYEVYRRLRLEITKYSMKDTNIAGKKLLDANKKFEDYSQNINHLKNMSRQKSETDLVEDFVVVADKLTNDLKTLAKDKEMSNMTVCTIPRAKTDSNYLQCQLMFRKAVSSSVDNIGLKNGTNAIKRVRNTKTTHNWRLENNFGDDPYKGITKDTCVIDKNFVEGKNVILVDDTLAKYLFIIADLSNI